MNYIFRTMIVPASIAPTCRALAEGLAGESGAGMWQVGLSPTGSAPATHYVSSGHVGDDMIGYLTDAAALAEAAEIPLAQAQALVTAADITDEQPFDAFDRLGLKLISEQ